MLVKKHPTLGVAVREDGAVMVKGAGRSRTYHWSFGGHRGSYMRVTIGSRSYNVHVLVAETFIGPRPDGMQIDHIDRDGTNNHVSNLRYVTPAENVNNRHVTDKIIAAIGCHERDDIKAYRRYYASTETGRRARKEASRRFWESHACMWFSDGSRHIVPMDVASELRKVPVSQRFFTRQ